MAVFLFYFVFMILSPWLIGAGQDECMLSMARCKDHGPTIRFPFWLKDFQPQRCGYPHPGFGLSCDRDNQTVLNLPTSAKVLVKNIDYKSQVIQVYDSNACLPRQFLNLNLSASPFQLKGVNSVSDMYALYNCSAPDRAIFRSVPCLGVHLYNVYAIYFINSIDSYPLTSCTKIQNLAPVPFYIFDQKKNNLFLSWLEPNCSDCEAKGKICSLKNYTTQLGTQCFDKPHKTRDASKILFILGVVSAVFLLVLAVIALYHVIISSIIEKENQLKVEKFLEDYRALKPTRYSNADIRRITNQFKDKIGQGGYGTVYKGKLSNEIFVAVKVLDNFNGNGEEFVNEVGTIGRIHHVNVVRLVGFCAEGFRRALVYEFLSNDSLEKFIFTARSNNTFLGWEKLQDIALGIARGIEYLHQGCDQQILHFDIKPHNILLDHNFVPKISDFGLAKLCSKEQSAVSMTAARGTVGYIAPEVLSRNFGRVSCKSDVYSFGMLLLEMVGGSKNIDATVNTSQVYFSEWIYNNLDQGEELSIQIEEDGDAKITKKLTIVGLWCIQWYPIDRPAMKVVVQMLEGEGDNLTLPPNPFASTNTARTNASTPGRPLQQELAVISEVE